MKTTIALLLLLVTTTGCQFSKSIKKDLITGLLTTGDGLSCDDIYLTVNNEKTVRTTFIYGEKFCLNFNTVEGFIKENENVFPGMQMIVISKTGDTLFHEKDLYRNYSDGVRISPLMLTGDLTVAAPMRSGNAYTLKILIWDKKGKGSITAKMDFKIIPNSQIRLETNKISFSEIYIFSKERDAVVTDNKIKFNENIYIIFEGCTGLKEIEGQVFPGLGIMISDQDGEKVLDYQDLFADSNDSGFGASDVKTRISSHITIPPMELKNPLHCNLTVWDKKNDGSGKISTDLTID